MIEFYYSKNVKPLSKMKLTQFIIKIIYQTLIKFYEI